MAIRSSPSFVALVPARAGSKRLADKNIRRLQGHPVLAYTIAAARQSGVFGRVIVSTDSERYAEVARHYGAEVPFLRPAELAGDKSPDIEWVQHALGWLRDHLKAFDCFSILRPTSPFRKPETIRRAAEQFLSEDGVDSLRAVEKCRQHPGKMWLVKGNRMSPLIPQPPGDVPWHSSQYAALPEVYVQNASLELAWSRVVWTQRTIAGDVVIPFFTQRDEGLDINDERDWFHIEHLLAKGDAQLPKVSEAPY